MYNLTGKGNRKIISFPYQKQFKATIIVKRIAEEHSSNTEDKSPHFYKWAANVLWKLQPNMNV